MEILLKVQANCRGILNTRMVKPWVKGTGKVVEFPPLVAFLE